MQSFRRVIIRLSRDEQGQNLIEYALLATFVILLAILSASLLGAKALLLLAAALMIAATRLRW
jgi:Flp pilus assembly pilin Flp